MRFAEVFLPGVVWQGFTWKGLDENKTLVLGWDVDRYEGPSEAPYDPMLRLPTNMPPPEGFS